MPLKAQFEYQPGIDDYALMAAVRERDQSALAALYDKYQAVVYAACLRSLRDKQEAEDLLVDIFWELWDRADRFDQTRGRPLAYILGLTRSRVVDRLRASRSRLRLQQPMDGDHQPDGRADESLPPPSAASLAEQRQRVTRAMEVLSPDQREALELAFFDGLSHGEVAQKLNQPLGTVKSRIRQGLIRIRQILGGDG
jgi:RNA polymerase sigma-70 factor (ECF subfamily)